MTRYSKTNHIIIEVDLQKEIFRLSSPVFEGTSSWPITIAKYFESMSNETTNLFLNSHDHVIFQNEIPFVWGPQPSLRQQFYQFMKRAHQCRHLFARLAQLEHRRNVDDIL